MIGYFRYSHTHLGVANRKAHLLTRNRSRFQQILGIIAVMFQVACGGARRFARKKAFEHFDLQPKWVR